MTNPTQQQAPSVVCPKCQGEMRQYERNGVTIDQCVECRGVFLDRGELEALLDANDAYYRRAGGGEPEAAGADDDGGRPCWRRRRGLASPGHRASSVRPRRESEIGGTASAHES